MTLVLLTVFLVLSAVFLIFFTYIFKEFKDDISDDNLFLARHIADEVSYFINQPADDLLELKKILDKENDTSRFQEIVSGMQNYIQLFGHMHIMDKNGRLIATAPYDKELIGLDFSRHDSFINSRQGLVYWSKSYISASTGSHTITISMNFKHGVIDGHFSLQELSELIKNPAQDEGFTAVINSQGTIIAHSTPSLAEQSYNIKNLESVQSALNGQYGTFNEVYERNPGLISISPVRQNGWSVIIFTPAKRAFNSIYQIRILSFAILIGLFLTTALSLHLMQKKLLQPLSHLSSQLKSITEGDYSITPTPVFNELEPLSEAVVELARKINLREQDLKTSEERFRSLVESSPFPVIVHRNGTYVYANPAAAEIHDITTPDSLNGKALFDFTFENERETIEKSIEKAQQERVQTTLHLNGHKNSPKTIDLILMPLEYLGEPSQLGIMFDITKNKKMEERLRQSEKMDTISQLAEGIAHDFNNMLGGIIGAVEMLEKKTADTPSLKVFTDIIRKASSRAINLTRQLLDFSRKGKMISTSISVHQIIEETLELGKRSIDPRIILSTNFQAQSDKVIGDPSQIQNALLNLFLNAKDAMPNGGELAVSTENLILTETSVRELSLEQCLKEGEYICITIRDTGCGIPPHVQNKIYEPFFTTKDQGKGTGLGLAAVYGAVKDHKGDLSLQSKVEVGTQFRIYLPLKCSSLNGEIPEPTPEQQPELKHPYTILLVDDEPIIKNITETILTSIGCTCITAENGEEASKIFYEQSSTIDLVILDMIMPVMNGPATYSAIRHINPHVKVLLSSGFSDDESVRKLLKKGANGFLMKPYQSSGLIKAIKDIFNEEQPA